MRTQSHIALTDAVSGNKWRFPAERIMFRGRMIGESEHVGAVIRYEGLDYFVTETPEQIDALLGVTGAPSGYPLVGTMVQVSGANSDLSDTSAERHYTECMVIGYTPCGLFACFQKPGCWPFVERLSNCSFKPAAVRVEVA